MDVKCGGESPQILYCDLETYSNLNLKVVGASRYAEGCEVLLWAYALGDSAPQVWDLTSAPAMPSDLKSYLDNPDIRLVWHNGVSFDTQVLRYTLGIDLPALRVIDTMHLALAHGLPAGLDKIAKVLNLQQKFDSDGALKRLFCIPFKGKKRDRHTHPDKWQAFIDYAIQDIEVMRDVHKALPKWNNTVFERDLFELDARINWGGIPLDIDLAQAASELYTLLVQEYEGMASSLTDGYLESFSQRDKTLAYIRETYGIELADLTAPTVEATLAREDIPAGLRKILHVRQMVSSTPVAKYSKAINATNTDGCMRGTLQLRGASRTGRWAGRMLQPQNLPHQFLNPEQTEDAIHAIKAGVAHRIYGDDIMPVMASCLRGLLIPQPDHKFLISDLANIEGRVQAWVCQEDWKLEAYRAYDRGEGKDLYVRAYAATFGVDPDEVTKAQRQVGKVMELAFAYNGGVSAFLNFGGRRLNFDELYSRIMPTAPEDIVSKAWRAWDWAQERGATFDLDAKTYVVCDVIKLLWRAAHPKISTFWGELERCAHEAVQSPEQTYALGRIKLRRAGDWLLIRKPSGQCLSYKSPRINANKLSFEGTLETTGTWGRIETYGGKLFENICQSLACDVFSEGLLKIDRRGISTRLTVHDEVVCEVPIDSATTARDVSALLATSPSWAQDIPLAAEGFEALRYRK